MRWLINKFSARRLAVLAILLCQCLLPTGIVVADSITDYNSYCIQLGCAYYDPNATGCQTATASAITTASTGLSSDVVQTINKLKPVYEQAATATGVPWQLLAAVHYREANNNPTSDLQAGNPIGGGGSQQATYPYGIPKSLEESAEFAAKQLTSLSTTVGVIKKPVNVPSPEAAAIKDTLFSYNGRADAYAAQAATLGFDSAKEPYEGSPYVMNNYDAVHKDMQIISKDHGAPDTIDKRFGAFAVYVFLGGAAGSGANGACSSSGAVAGSAVQTAINYAWPDYHNPPYLIMKPSYADAIAKAQANGEYVGGGSHPGVDCGGFVTRVMRDSGADPNYNWGPKDARQGPTTQQQAYMDAHPEKYQNLGPQSSTANLQPGDIAVNSSHTYLYVGKQAGFNNNSASASFSTSGESWRTPMASNAYFSNDAGSFIWYRLIKAG